MSVLYEEDQDRTGFFVKRKRSGFSLQRLLPFYKQACKFRGADGDSPVKTTTARPAKAAEVPMPLVSASSELRGRRSSTAVLLIEANNATS